MRSMSLILPANEIGAHVVTVDDLLLYMGEFGLYQKYLFFMCFPFCCFLAFVLFSQIFITLIPQEHWCKLPKTNMSIEDLRKLAIPKSGKVPHEGHQLPYSRCWIYNLPIEEIIQVGAPQNDWPMKKCDKWDFNYTSEDVPYSTIATKLEWVCDNAYLQNSAQSIFFMGAICGGFLFGWLADKYGRVPALIGVNIMGFIGGLGSIFCKNFWQFSVCRFIMGFAYDNTFILMYILLLEYIGPKWRTFVANMSYGIFYSLGSMAMPWMAYYIADWKIFSLVTTIPLLFVIFVTWLLPESARWLVTKGEIERTLKILTRIEKVNKSHVPHELYEDFIDGCIETAEEFENENYNLIDLFRTPRLRLFTILLTLSWSIMEMAYDGHIRCLDSLGMDVFTTFTVGAATEFPAEIILILVLDHLGRKWSLVGSVMLSGLASFGASRVPIGIYFASFATVGRLFINIATNVGLQYASELLPTVVRGEGVSFIHNMGFLTSILSPFIAYTSKIQYNMPMMILGTVSILAGILCLFLPETLKENLPQTILEGELFGIDQKFWFNPCDKRNIEVGSSQHYLHARRPTHRSAILRSSMVSGHVGNSWRFNAIMDSIKNSDSRVKAENESDVNRSPTEYMNNLREERRKKKFSIESTDSSKPGSSKSKGVHYRPSIK